MDNKEFRQITQTVFKANGFEKLKTGITGKARAFYVSYKYRTPDMDRWPM